MAFEDSGVLGGHREPDLGAGVGRHRLAQLFGELSKVLVGQDHGQPVPNGRHRMLAGMAHLPQFEDPATVADVIAAALPVH